MYCDFFLVTDKESPGDKPICRRTDSSPRTVYQSNDCDGEYDPYWRRGGDGTCVCVCVWIFVHVSICFLCFPIPLIQMLDEVRPVGPQKMGTSLAGNKTSEVVVLLRDFPNGNFCQ